MPNMTEILYPDGSRSQFTEGGGSFHEGELAIIRLQLITCRSALSMYIKYEGKMQLTRNGAQMAIKNVIEPLTGKTYKGSMNGKREALADCEALLAMLEESAVVLEGVQPTCDVCGKADEEVDWCGVCGCCREHCQKYVGCPR